MLNNSQHRLFHFNCFGTNMVPHGLLDIICYLNLQFLNHIFIIKTKVLLPQPYVILTDFCQYIYAFWFSWSQRLLNYLTLNYFSLSGPDEGYSRNASYELNLIFTFYWIWFLNKSIIIRTVI